MPPAIIIAAEDICFWAGLVSVAMTSARLLFLA